MWDIFTEISPKNFPTENLPTKPSHRKFFTKYLPPTKFPKEDFSTTNFHQNFSTESHSKIFALFSLSCCDILTKGGWSFVSSSLPRYQKQTQSHRNLNFYLHSSSNINLHILDIHMNSIWFSTASTRIFTHTILFWPFSSISFWIAMISSWFSCDQEGFWFDLSGGLLREADEDRVSENAQVCEQLG